MERIVKFNKFRNIGIEKPEILVLNSNFEKGKCGNILVVIGGNNSGKSNVLDGVYKLANNKPLEKRDITTLHFDDEYRQPTISLCYRDENNDVEFVKNLTSKGSWEIKKGSNFKYTDLSKKAVINDLDCIINAFTRSGFQTPSYTGFIQLKESITSDDSFKIENYHDKILNQVNYLRSSYQSVFNSVWSPQRGNKLKIIDYALNNIWENNQANEVASILEMNSLPSIYRYEEKQLSNTNLRLCDISTLNSSNFFTSLFKILGVDSTTIINAYRQFNETSNIAVLEKLKKDCEKKMDTINKQFNKMYFASNDQYKFTLSFESKNIFFGMARGKGEDPIILDYQSTGFKWFFNFYFNFLALNSLQPGDIVIMDEPATNLHPQGQVELRRFIKEYAVKNDVLFILATHSPFMIDIDNFDELRVISMDNNRSIIDNTFTAVNVEDPDSLLPIKESLTIKQNVLYDLDTEIVWVEGITDYIYLTMFKKFFQINNIAFLPFNGVGNNKEQTKGILEKLISLKFHRRSLLVDGDKAGKDMYGQAKDSAFEVVHILSEIELDNGKKAMTIEDLFSDEDKKKYNVIKDKRSLGASELKIHATIDDFSEETVNNFKKLFDLLEDN